MSLLPEMIHVSDQNRLTTLVPVIHEETRADRLGRGLILERLLEVLLIEALRSDQATILPPGLLRGLSDPQLSGALQRIHAEPSSPLSVSELTKAAGMSRSGFSSGSAGRLAARHCNTPSNGAWAWPRPCSGRVD